MHIICLPSIYKLLLSLVLCEFLSRYNNNVKNLFSFIIETMASLCIGAFIYLKIILPIFLITPESSDHPNARGAKYYWCCLQQFAVLLKLNMDINTWIMAIYLLVIICYVYYLRNMYCNNQKGKWNYWINSMPYCWSIADHFRLVFIYKPINPIFAIAIPKSHDRILWYMPIYCNGYIWVHKIF